MFVSIGGEDREIVKDLFGVKRFTKISAKKEGDDVLYTAVISTEKTVTDADIFKAISENTFIRSISREEDEL